MYILFRFFPPDSAFLDIDRLGGIVRALPFICRPGIVYDRSLLMGKPAYEKEQYVRYVGMHSSSLKSVAS